jgi:transposase-like protein
MGARAPKQRAPRRRWPSAEKRRLVELTLRPGSSVAAIARDHGVYPNSLRQWKALYLAGKLEAQPQSTNSPGTDPPAAGTTFLPVSLIRAVPKQPATRLVARACGSSVVELVLVSGASLRIETDAIDAAFVCALLAELRR